MRASASVGKLPAQYEEIARKAVTAAINTPYQLTTISGYETDLIGAIKTAAESTYEDSAWASEAAFKAAVETKIADFAGAKVESVDFSGGTATVELRYGYSTATAEITYSPDAVAAQWTAYIESTKLGSTTVPGSNMTYSQAPDIQKAMTDGYSAIWAAKTETEANAALTAAKANLLTAVQNYVKFLLDKVYNSGKATILGDVAYTLPKEAYTKASGDIDAATTEADVLNAYDTALKAQTSKQHPILKKTEAKAATYTETGNHEYYTCETCGKVFKDAAGTQETTVEAETIAKLTRPSSGGSSSSDRSYAVTAPSAKNGDVTVSPKNASKGDRVTITVTPDKGYELDSLTVKDASGNKLKLTDKGNGKYTFTMPGSKVTVSAEFVEEQAASIFADVPADAYYAKAVEWAVKKGITNGKANGLFGSNDPCTRGQIVTFLWRAAGSPAPKGTVKVPADVLPGSYCYDAVAWALENGITNGLADGTFGVNNTCTRGQSVTFLYRAMGTAPTTVNGFTDVESNAFCAEAVAWAVENGVTNGTSASTFSPSNGCTRAQIVTFLFRAYNK